MSIAIMESGALILTFLMGLEMYRQRIPWRGLIVRCAVAFAILTIMIVSWRGL